MYHIMAFQLATGTEDRAGGSVAASPREFPIGLEFVRNRELPTSISPLSFDIEVHKTIPDFLEISGKGGAALCSQRFIDILSAEKTRFAAFPAQVYDGTSDSALDGHFLWIPDRLSDAIDYEHSEVWTEPESGQRYITTLMLTPQMETLSPAVFRPDEKVIFLAHERIRQVMSAEAIRGVEFLPLDAVHQQADGRKVRELEQQLLSEPNNGKLWGDLGVVLWRLHHNARSLAAVDRALALQPNAAEVWQLRGKVLQSLGDLDSAIDAYQHSLRIEIRALALVDYAGALFAHGRHRDALDAVERAVVLNPELPDAWYQMGCVLNANGRFEGAIDAFDRVEAILKGSLPQALLGKGDSLEMLGCYEKALAAYSQGLEYTPNNVEMWQRKAAVLRKLARCDEAEAAEQRAAQLAQRRVMRQSQRPL